MGKDKLINSGNKRLLFIDMARSLAILMMIEGHFTGAALGTEYRNEHYMAYSIWFKIHGITSPLFFTVTGLVFVFLLTRNPHISFFKNERVSKGFRRILELLFWGYFIQFSLLTVIQSIYYKIELNLEWFSAFHVLQSISFGIFFLLIIYGLYKLIAFGKLHWYYLIAALILFSFDAQLIQYIRVDEELLKSGVISSPSYLPMGAPKFIQNMFYGKYDDFSFMSYSGYTLLGGMLGSLIRDFKEQTKTWWFGTLFIIIGLCLNYFNLFILKFVDHWSEIIGLTDHGVFKLNSASFYRFGQVVSILGVFMLIDRSTNMKQNLFLKFGQNTLPIYIVHVIILYGGIFGLGLYPFVIKENLDPYTSVSISLCALLFFCWMVYKMDKLSNLYNQALKFIFRK